METNNLKFTDAGDRSMTGYDNSMEIKRMFTSMSANQWIDQAASRPDPVPLWLNLWYEGEVSCLFADTNVGKSIYAIQIADEISKRQTVLYFDFEMSDKQFQLRYTDSLSGTTHRFNDNFKRVEFSRVGSFSLDMQSIIDQIELEVTINDCKVVIIDNISWICNRSESGDAAGELMQLLIDLKKRKGLSILVLAHTPKRSISSPLTQNSLAGSKRIANFLDSIFAIGCSRANVPAGRYVKQIKTRNSELKYGENNVIVGEIVKQGDYISIVHTGNGRERDHLLDPPSDQEEREQAKAQIIQLLNEGATYRAIANELGVSQKTIADVKKK